MRFALAALVLAAGFTGPAAAQYYGQGYGAPPPYEYDRPRRAPPRDYDEEGSYRRGPPRDFGDDGYRRGPPPGARRGSAVCVTSRGSCPIGAVVPRLTPCGCEVPGFGYKRGAAG